jgi:hypothetical protein
VGCTLWDVVLGPRTVHCRTRVALALFTALSSCGSLHSGAFCHSSSVPPLPHRDDLPSAGIGTTTSHELVCKRSCVCAFGASTLPFRRRQKSTVSSFASLRVVSTQRTNPAVGKLVWDGGPSVSIDVCRHSGLPCALSLPPSHSWVSCCCAAVRLRRITLLLLHPPLHPVWY